MSSPVLLPPWHKRPEDRLQVAMPRASLDALFDLLSHLEVNEFEQKLRFWTELSDREIADAGYWLDALYEFLYREGLRPRRMRKDRVREKIRPAVGKLVRADGNPY